MNNAAAAIAYLQNHPANAAPAAAALSPTDAAAAAAAAMESLQRHQPQLLRPRQEQQLPPVQLPAVNGAGETSRSIPHSGPSTHVDPKAPATSAAIAAQKAFEQPLPPEQQLLVQQALAAAGFHVGTAGLSAAQVPVTTSYQLSPGSSQRPKAGSSHLSELKLSSGSAAKQIPNTPPSADVDKSGGAGRPTGAIVPTDGASSLPLSAATPPVVPVTAAATSVPPMTVTSAMGPASSETSARASTTTLLQRAAPPDAPSSAPPNGHVSTLQGPFQPAPPSSLQNVAAAQQMARDLQAAFGLNAPAGATTAAMAAPAANAPMVSHANDMVTHLNFLLRTVGVPPPGASQDPIAVAANAQRPASDSHALAAVSQLLGVSIADWNALMPPRGAPATTAAVPPPGPPPLPSSYPQSSIYFPPLIPTGTPAAALPPGAVSTLQPPQQLPANLAVGASAGYGLPLNFAATAPPGPAAYASPPSAAPQPASQLGLPPHLAVALQSLGLPPHYGAAMHPPPLPPHLSAAFYGPAGANATAQVSTPIDAQTAAVLALGSASAPFYMPMGLQAGSSAGVMTGPPPSAFVSPVAAPKPPAGSFYAGMPPPPPPGYALFPPPGAAAPMNGNAAFGAPPPPHP